MQGFLVMLAPLGICLFGYIRSLRMKERPRAHFPNTATIVGKEAGGYHYRPRK